MSKKIPVCGPWGWRCWAARNRHGIYIGLCVLVLVAGDWLVELIARAIFSV